MVIPVPWTTKLETRSGFPCAAYRWVFQTSLDFFGFVHQYQFSNKWHDDHSAVNGVLLGGLWRRGRGPWRWGLDHVYYDGTHCLYHVGPVALQWYNPSCPECHDSAK